MQLETRNLKLKKAIPGGYSLSFFITKSLVDLDATVFDFDVGAVFDFDIAAIGFDDAFGSAALDGNGSCSAGIESDFFGRSVHFNGESP